MLSEKGCRERRAALEKKIAGRTDWIVLTSPHHVLYFSNLWVEPNSLAHHSLAVLAWRGGESALFVDSFLSREARTAFADQVVVVPCYGDVRPVPDRRKAVMERAAAWLSAKRPGTVAAETAYLPAALAADLRGTGAAVLDVLPLIEEMRCVKYPDELDLMRSLVRDASSSLDAVREQVHAGLSEWAVYGLLHREFVTRRCMPLSLIADIVTDLRVSGLPRDRRLEKGDLVIIDFSPYSGGYRADISATLRVDTPPGGRQVEYMEALFQARARAEALLRPGVPGREVYGAMAGCFAQRGLGRFFTGHAGHGLGLLQPERPYFLPYSDEPLAAGQVVTLEPGLYDGRVGHMRIEDVYIIGPDGAERISRHRPGF